MFQQRILVPSDVSENALERTLAIMSYGSGAARPYWPKRCGRTFTHLHRM
jgi:hypothetical protein